MLIIMTLCRFTIVYSFISLRAFVFFFIWGYKWKTKLLWVFAHTLPGKHKLSLLLGKCLGVVLLNHIKCMLNYIRKCPIVSQNYWTILHSQQHVREFQLLHVLLSIWYYPSSIVSFCFVLFVISIGKWWCLVVVLVSISLMTNCAEHLIMNIFAIHVCSLVRCLFKLFANFLLGCLFPYF